MKEEKMQTDLSHGVGTRISIPSCDTSQVMHCQEAELEKSVGQALKHSNNGVSEVAV